LMIANVLANRDAIGTDQFEPVVPPHQNSQISTLTE